MSTPTTNPSFPTFWTRSPASKPVPVATSRTKSQESSRLVLPTTLALHCLSCPKVRMVRSRSYSDGTLENRLRTYQAFGSVTESGYCGCWLLRLRPHQAVADGGDSGYDNEDGECHRQKFSCIEPDEP